ncbi:S8 family serine peptidase [Bryobacter aggregatus]|uniref:S8 family serine peptidase n=1 Tax=Bryobacter aggregatus TaxID=360054 RepID=UPI0004E26C43|nr:S8 family serine peptidase [Bryobacter aggregatus]
MRLIFLLLLSLPFWGQFVPNQYIVVLKNEPGEMRQAERRTRVRQRQNGVRSELSARGFQTLGHTELVANALMVEGQNEETDVRQLRQLAGVERVHKVRLFQKTLDRAAQVHAVAAAWERLGLEHAGAGMKIGILDSGIEASHPGFQSATLPVLEGFPKWNYARDQAYTNNKVIVARSYPTLWAYRDPDPSVLDRSGHGTAVAMSAAGVSHDSPIGPLAGMAPAAYLGVYKIFGTPGYNDSTTDSAILQAIEDAVSDGMDVINMSFGSMLAARPENDPIVQALAKAEEAGVIVVVSAGNDGPGHATLSSPGTAPTALTVGASENGRLFAAGLIAADGSSAPALAGSQTTGTNSIAAAMVSAGLACDRFSGDRLRGQIALIVRGTCSFEVKINNAATAGAVAAVIYSDAARSTDFITMSAGAATLPAVFLRYADGIRYEDELSKAASLDVTLDLAVKARDVSPDRLASFSARGPVSGVPIKPDLVAVGTNVYTAAESNYAGGEVYSASGYGLINGTSFSSPITAGAAAVLKAARPGLKPIDYRSLLVNSAKPLPQLTVVQSGAGLLHLTNALDATLRFEPISVSFTAKDHTIQVTNLQSTAATYQVSVEAKEGIAPAISTSELELPPHEAATLTLSLDLPAVAPGAYSGVVLLQQEGGAVLRVPYWYGKAKEEAAEIQVLYQASSARSGTVQQDLLFFRVMDENGMVLGAKPSVTVVSGAGNVREVQDRDFDVAGAIGVELVLGRGTNVIEVDAGNGVTQRFAFTGR